MPHSTRFLNRILAARFRAFVPSSGRCAVRHAETRNEKAMSHVTKACDMCGGCGDESRIRPKRCPRAAFAKNRRTGQEFLCAAAPFLL